MSRSLLEPSPFSGTGRDLATLRSLRQPCPSATGGATPEPWLRNGCSPSGTP